MAIDPARTVRGALAGAAAAGVWAAQQPLDKRAFESRYDDVELLGKAVTQGERWFAVGLAMHLANGAAFGAAYAAAAPALPLTRPLAAVAAAMAENFALWPLGRATDRFHPARADLPRLSGNGRALAQATWRHLLFGLVLGELERRLNPEPDPAEDFAHVISSNGHGNLEHAVAAEVAGGAGSAS
jgi:hypothetical protein